MSEDGKITSDFKLTDAQFCVIYAVRKATADLIQIPPDLGSQHSKSNEFCSLKVCHVTGMLSACANPIIYGYCNENFNKEFRYIEGPDYMQIIPKVAL